MKILLVSDEESPFIWDFFQPEKFRDIDLIISCGDLDAKYLSFLVTMIKAPLFYVPGNHDVRYINEPPEGCDNIDGNLVKFKNLRILGLGGSHKYSNASCQYTEKEMGRRILKLQPKLFLNKGFDILVTHAPAFGIGDENDSCHRGFKSFINLMDKYSPSFFFHGHVHLNYGRKPRFNKYKNTKIINAYEYNIVEL
ncbi:metallophosphoesterase family protein [Candidatus Clostridium radicumherbarum]|uniref:Metallophosphoesterase n=1 Tax=Candidatus Clostridium radicumherbarum TaxID=3381662 RepID=A0ABW8TUU8_9CLOT